MKVLLVCPAATIYDAQNRVMGWKHTPCSRAAMKELKALVPRLQELGPVKVVGSDLDHDSVWLLSRKLRIPYEEWTSLRRLNAGKLHGSDTAEFEKVWSAIERPEVPVKGGDSPISYRNRLAASRAKLAKLEGPVVLVVPLREMSELTGTASVKPGRVYEWSLS